MTEEANERRDRGEAMFKAVYGEDLVPLPPREGRTPFVTNTIEQLFAEIWSRDVLSIRDRRLLLLGAVASLGEPMIAEIQLRSALAHGELTVEQAHEVVAFIVHYVGYPRATMFNNALRKVLAEMPES